LAADGDFFELLKLSPLKIGLTLLHPSCILPVEGRSEIKAFPLDGERLDRGESLSHMVPFSFSVGERKLMNHFAVK
jgi:hypothetical protein